MVVQRGMSTVISPGDVICEWMFKDIYYLLIQILDELNLLASFQIPDLADPLHVATEKYR